MHKKLCEDPGKGLHSITSKYFWNYIQNISYFRCIKYIQEKIILKTNIIIMYVNEVLHKKDVINSMLIAIIVQMSM